jgi:2-aminoadipate transaminase
MERALTRELQGLVTWPKPRGGFFLWAALPQEMDSQVLLRRAMDHGVIFVAGGAFFVDGSGRYFIRLSFSQQTPERIEDGCVRLAAAIKEEHAALQQGAAHTLKLG